MHTDGWGRCDPRAQQQQPNPNLQLCAWTACARGRHVHVDGMCTWTLMTTRGRQTLMTTRVRGCQAVAASMHAGAGQAADESSGEIYERLSRP
jgi:hypothetical protein